jgi:hypothetical protein
MTALLFTTSMGLRLFGRDTSRPYPFHGRFETFFEKKAEKFCGFGNLCYLCNRI